MNYENVLVSDWERKASIENTVDTFEPEGLLFTNIRFDSDRFGDSDPIYRGSLHFIVDRSQMLARHQTPLRIDVSGRDEVVLDFGLTLREVAELGVQLRNMASQITFLRYHQYLGTCSDFIGIRPWNEEISTLSAIVGKNTRRLLIFGITGQFSTKDTPFIYLANVKLFESDGRQTWMIFTLPQLIAMSHFLFKGASQFS